MQLIDALSPRDKETIKHYIQLYAGVAEPAPLSKVLQVWNKKKRTLYKALGHNLRARIPVEIPRNTLYYQHELKAIYDVYPIWDDRDAQSFLQKVNSMRRVLHNDFIFEYLKFIAEADWCNTDKYNASRLILHQNIENGYLTTVWDETHSNEAYHFQAFKSTIKNNMRTVRTIQKVLKAMHFPHMDLFEKWRNAVSDININKDIKADLVISIHPIDFMTMSDNNCDWSSCMSWIGRGSYSAGTIEMMNSNMAVVCYLESKTPFNIIFDDEEFNIPNKSWRILLYVHKDILVAGKAYPYFNEGLTKCCLDQMRQLLKNNLGWNYKYINQQYKDNQHINNNFFLKSEGLYQFSRPKNRKKQKHAIYLYTNCMYNDLIEYKDTYWCCRNWVPKTIKLCVSGPATCMCCGEKIEEPSYISSYDDIGGEKICGNCRQHRHCDVCNTIRYTKPLYSFDRGSRSKFNICSNDCLNDMIYVPYENQLYNKEKITTDTYFVIGNDSGFIDSDPVLNFINKNNSYWGDNNNVIENLKKEDYFKTHAKIIRVPYWVFYNYMLCYTYSSTLGYRRRPDCFRYVKFFDPEEQFKDTEKNIFEIIEETKRWVPAKEVVHEISSSLSI